MTKLQQEKVFQYRDCCWLDKKDVKKNRK